MRVFGGPIRTQTNRLHQFFNPVGYLTQTEQYLETMDVVSGLVKAAVFGFLVALMGFALLGAFLVRLG